MFVVPIPGSVIRPVKGKYVLLLPSVRITRLNPINAIELIVCAFPKNLRHESSVRHPNLRPSLWKRTEMPWHPCFAVR